MVPRCSGAVPFPQAPQKPSSTDSEAGTAMGQQPSTCRRTADGALAILWVFLAQFLMMGLDVALSSSPFPFPSAILAMFLVFTILLAVGYAWEGMPGFYDKFLRGPADLVNRHMSIGFSVPIVLLCRLPTAPPRTIGLIMACFVIAGTIATPAVYFMALSLQKSLVACIGLVSKRRRRRQRPRPNDEESQNRAGQPTAPTSDQDRPKAFTSEASSMASTHGETPDDDRDNNTPSPPTTTARQQQPSGHQSPQCSTPHHRLLKLALRNPFTVISWLVLLTVGIPLRFAAGVDSVLTISLLFALWFSVLAAQARVARMRALRSWPKSRTCLTVSLNAVLWTALGLIAYAYAESAVSRRPVPGVLDLLQQNTTLTNLILHRRGGAHHAHALGAGDMALAILNAGLVSWGLKLWEYRRRLASRAGATILSVSLISALLNVALGPPLARAVGLAGPPAYDLAFAARTATLALGGPAMSRLGGDLGLNAALVVANGIVFQMGLGLGVGAWLHGAVGRLEEWWCGMKMRMRMMMMMKHSGGGDGGAGRAGDARGGEDARGEETEARTVAVGVTIGINAAAMGTAHLYEGRSEAAPYATLSMTVFGVATVGFTMVPQLASWVVGSITPGGS